MSRHWVRNAVLLSFLATLVLVVPSVLIVQHNSNCNGFCGIIDGFEIIPFELASIIVLLVGIKLTMMRRWLDTATVFLGSIIVLLFVEQLGVNSILDQYSFSLIEATTIQFVSMFAILAGGLLLVGRLCSRYSRHRLWVFIGAVIVPLVVGMTYLFVAKYQQDTSMSQIRLQAVQAVGITPYLPVYSLPGRTVVADTSNGSSDINYLSLQYGRSATIPDYAIFEFKSPVQLAVGKCGPYDPIITTNDALGPCSVASTTPGGQTIYIATIKGTPGVSPTTHAYYLQLGSETITVSDSNYSSLLQDADVIHILNSLQPVTDQAFSKHV